ncbi:hypothetical protein CVD25_08445 [Bacillus canaveralius]|uniref:Uncharacterized protein n=1 Tax=Bacillus canaveralius TaxID=1403243 RepID=A0A2N5GID7_9BACI|nr:hypothetical protein [Bacillus sp. V33-4]PLR80736.1 hypothetical protein CU635_16925 [Bacillus canaveralius]PLR81726.1 hypothetical protein CVD23_18295 [Bacillus sp. V33-4]PLR98386.1 hypothetical protein CVD25_08445 [Bacillus canaveralius]
MGCYSSNGCACDVLRKTAPGTGVTLGFNGVSLPVINANFCKGNHCATFVSSTGTVTIADCRKINFVAFSP